MMQIVKKLISQITIYQPSMSQAVPFHSRNYRRKSKLKEIQNLNMTISCQRRSSDLLTLLTKPLTWGANSFQIIKLCQEVSRKLRTSSLISKICSFLLKVHLTLPLNTELTYSESQVYSMLLEQKTQIKLHTLLQTSNLSSMEAS